MSKNKNDLAMVLNDVLEIVADLLEVNSTVQKILIKVPPIVGVIRNTFDIPDEPIPFPEEEKPKKVSTKKKAEPKPEEAAPETKTYTKVEVRKYLAKVADQHREEVKALLNKYGADNLTQLDESHYADIMADAEEIENA